MRLFAGVEIPEDHRRSVETAIGPLKGVVPGGRWTAPAGWHATLRFFGEVPEDRVADLEEALGRAVAGEAAAESRLLGLGAFPTTRRARVLWVGLEDRELRLATLAQRIGAESGFPADRPLHPHLTLARFKVPTAVGPILDRLSPFPLAPDPFPVDALCLFRSHPGPGGSRYEIRRRWQLSTGGQAPADL